MIITIDGPSGSGKTTLALMLAKKLNFFCLSSGYLYRGLAYVLKKVYHYNAERMKKPDQKDIHAVFQNGQLRYEYQAGLIKMFWVEDITYQVKDVEIAKFAALLAQNEVVRSCIKKYENNLIAGKNVVVEGRACGSVWHPDAALKIYLDASVDVRAARLQQDQMKRGNVVLLHEAKQLVIARDGLDRTRTIDPLVVPEGAVVLDSSTLVVGDVLEQAFELVAKIEQPNS